MEDFKQEYLAMRRDIARGYGQHSFQKGWTKGSLRRRCTSMLQERCRGRNGRIESPFLVSKLERVLNASIENNLGQATIVSAVRIIGMANYEQLMNVYMTINLHTANEEEPEEKSEQEHEE